MIKNWFLIESDTVELVKNPPSDISSNLLGRIRAGGGCVSVGGTKGVGTVWNTLKGGRTERRGG